MALHGQLRDRQRPADLGIARTLPQQRQHLRFSGREHAVGGAGKPPQAAAPHPGAAGMHLADRRGDLTGIRLLREIATGAGPLRTIRVHRALG